MSSFKDKSVQLLLSIAALILLTFVNLFIAFPVAAIVFFGLFKNGHGMSRDASLGVSVIVAFFIHGWIAYNHKLREFLKSTRSDNE